ncbi:cytosine permease [Argonema antarcticum]|uniref:cytosine permease n=1 Tax=Argonema antarcticum TaxID=2942763 RepID=UPI00201117C5|nr:cytosine permease [Argonema antarcticum]MCL1472717.1 cytosine permease [Argonema antarcticum A004/B2]
MNTTSEPEFSTLTPVSEDYTLSAVRANARKSMRSLAPLLIGFTLSCGTLFAGGLVSPAFRFWPDLVGLIILGNLILGSYTAGLSYIAAKSGLSTVLMARFSFGNVGSRWVDFILSFIQISWYGWGSALIADSLNKLMDVPVYLNWLTILVCTYLCCATAYFGYRFIDWLSRFAVSTMLFLMFWILAIAMSKLGGFEGLQAIQPTQQLAWGEALTIVVGTLISNATQATNNRHLTKTGSTTLITTLAAFFFVNGFFIICGAFSSLLYANEDVVQALAQEGLLFWGLLLLLLNMWTTQANTIDAFSVAGSQIFRINKWIIFALGGATVALVLAWGGIYIMLLPYLKLLGTFIPPLGGAIVSDYWLVHRGQFPSPEARQPAFNWAGIITYPLACAIAYFYPGIKPINGFIAAVMLYFVLSKIIGRGKRG